MRQGKKHHIIVDEKFQNLFMSMVRCDPMKRATIYQIQNDSWYHDSIYTEDEIELLMKDSVHSKTFSVTNCELSSQNI